MQKLRLGLLAKCGWLVALASALAGCDSNQTSGGGCAVGNERCACYPNKTCNGKLTCLSNVCVDSEAGGDGNGGEASVSSGGATTGTSTVASDGGTDSGSGGVAVAAAGSSGVTPMETGGTSAVASGGAVAAETGGASTTATGGATPLGTGGTQLVATGGAPVVATGGVPAVAGASGVTAGPNMLVDPTFQEFPTYWNATLNEGDSGSYTRPPNTADVCVTNTATSTTNYQLAFSLGYPRAAGVGNFAIEAGATYTFSYRVSATGLIDFEAKIGQAVEPYDTIYSYISDAVTSSYKTFSHQFTAATSDASAGLVFNVVLDMPGKMCFAEVSLAKNL